MSPDAAGAPGSARVGLVVVSHSSAIADGVAELAAQMAPDVVIGTAGGTDEGGIGTSLEKIQAALSEAEGGAGVVVLCDLGSAVMTAESAIEFLDESEGTRVRLADAPIVEGAVAAAVAAETGAGLEEVLSAAQSAAGGASVGTGSAGEDGTGADSGDGTAASADQVSRTVTLVNASGLHARPAAEFVKLAGTFDAAVTVNGVDAKSLLGIMSLGATKGTTVTIAAGGPDGDDAVAALADLVESGFGEAEG